MMIGVGGVAAIYSTTFPSTENPISQGAIWLNGGTDGVDWQDCRTTPGLVFATNFVGTPNAYNDCLAVLKAASYPVNADQYAQGTIYRASGYFPSSNSHEVELLSRWSLSANDAHGYELIVGLTTSQAYLAVVKWNGAIGSYVALWEALGVTEPVTGDVFRFEVTGSVAKIYINGTKIGPSSTASGNTGIGTLDVDLTKDTAGNTVSTWSSGQPGVGFWPQSGSTLASFGWSQFSVGNL